MGWPATGALIRAGIAIAGGAMALRGGGGGLSGIFLAAGLGMVSGATAPRLRLIERVCGKL